ncbi:MAG: alpha-N-arabinofuranosidase [Oscillospiraceae bacterium]|jgi:alpha-N-arabinofuranosidase|nr:alpha-N-arabinofuranosidase [Oscillospiraceae bacterium]
MAHLLIDTQSPRAPISRHIFGHFAEHLGRCIYGGLYVGENSPIPNVRGMRKDVVDALKNIGIPNLRWPGGCFADEYHWKDGIGKPETRKRMVNTHWGGVIEDNSFGTHEFLELCEQLGCEPYITGNLGSGTVQEMQEWVEYMTFGGVSPMADLRRANGREDAWRVKYFGVGNENWGCGGNMRPEFYADQYRRYQTYLRNFGENKLYKIACGPNSGDLHWTEVLMREAGRMMDALSLHYYTVLGSDWAHKGPATGFTEADYYETLRRALRIGPMIDGHLAVMDRYDPQHRVGLIVDEWGTWFDVEPGTNPGFLYQQNTMRDAMVAAASLDIFAQRSDRIPMANIAQTVNVLQSPILTDGAAMVLTPTYHVYDLYRAHHDAARLDATIASPEMEGMPQLSALASLDAEGAVHITLTNRAIDAPAEITMKLPGCNVQGATGRLLTGAMGDYNDFDHPDTVGIRALDGIGVKGDQVTVTLPACSVATIRVER